MKFGKSIRAESRSNRGLAFINFKFLKRIIKRSAIASRAGCADAAAIEDAAFLSALDAELAKVAAAYWNELQEIAPLQDSVSAASLEFLPHSDLYRNMTFEQLQAHLEGLGGLRERDEPPANRSPSEASTVASPVEDAAALETADCGGVPSSARASVALCEFCVTLSQLSARCKRLRGCVLWNVVAVLKILKKRHKQHGSGSGRLIPVSPMDILAKQAWYREPQLPKVVSTVETTIGTLMSKLSNRLPCRDEYRCPICLEVVVDPVYLRACGHRFCWACLCQAYLNKPDGTLERCPTCRSAFALDPLAFQVDGILSRFLRYYFPEEINHREQEQKECLDLRLRRQIEDDHAAVVQQPLPMSTSCCPDCPSQAVMSKTLNERAANWIGENELCAHALRVRSGKPADVSHLVMASDKDYSTAAAAPVGIAASATERKVAAASVVRDVVCTLLEDDSVDIDVPPIFGLGVDVDNDSHHRHRGKWQFMAIHGTSHLPMTAGTVGSLRPLPILSWNAGLPPPSQKLNFVVNDDNDDLTLSEDFIPIISACKSMHIGNVLDDEDDLDYARCCSKLAIANDIAAGFC